jgi:transcriptional regulator with XRE-family HTH domain
MGLGACIRSARQKCGLTLQGLASRSSVTAAHLSNIENEKVSLSRRVLEQIAAVLGLDADELLAEQAGADRRQAVVDRRGRSSTESYLLELLARALHQDVVSGKPLASSGWRALDQLLSDQSSGRAQMVVDGLLGLGLIDLRQRPRTLRLRVEANRQNVWVRKSLDLQEYRDYYAADERILKTAVREIDELLRALTSQTAIQTAEACLVFTGLAMAIREAELHIEPEELLRERLLLQDFDQAHVRLSGNAAFAALPDTITQARGWRDFSQAIIALWHATPSCGKSRHWLCEPAKDIPEPPGRALSLLVAALRTAGLDRIPRSQLTAVYGSWVLWRYLERRRLLPITDEARTGLWAPTVYERLCNSLSDLPHNLEVASEQVAQMIEKARTAWGPYGEHADDSNNGVSTGGTQDFSHHRLVELFHFPWDDA